MAITKLSCVRESSGHYPAKHLYNLLRYIVNPFKTDNGRLVGGLNCMPDWKTAYMQMINTKQMWEKTDMRQGYHFIISFSPDEEVSEDVAFAITKKFVSRYIGEQYECLYSVHNDQEHMHSHIVFNSVSRIDGYKYRYELGDWRKHIQPIVNDLCKEYGLSVLNMEFAGFENEYGEVYDRTGKMNKNFEEVMQHGGNLDRKSWQNRKAKRKDMLDFIKADIDEVLPRCRSWEDVVAALKEIGWKVRDRTKDGKNFLRHYVVEAPFDGAASIRPDNLGYGYSREGILERLEKKIYAVNDDIAWTAEYDVLADETMTGSALTSGKFARTSANIEIEKAPQVKDWNWKKVYRSEKYLEYRSNYTSAQKKTILQPWNGYKPHLTDYQKKRVAALYRSGQMQHYNLNTIPMKYRPNVVQLKELQEQTAYIVKNRIGSEAALIVKMENIKKQAAKLRQDRHDLYNIRFGAKEALAFAFFYLKATDQSPKDIEKYETIGKNIERQELALQLLPFLATSSDNQIHNARSAGFTNDDIEQFKKLIHQEFEKNSYMIETEESFLHYISLHKVQRAPEEWRKKTVDKLEKMAYSRNGLEKRKIANELLADEKLMKHLTYDGVRVKLKKMFSAQGMEGDALDKKVNSFLIAMKKVETSGKFAQSNEDCIERLKILAEHPERNTKAIDHVKKIKEEYPDPEKYREAIVRTLAAGNYDITTLDDFLDNFKRGEKALEEKQKKLEKEWKLCQKIRSHDFPVPERGRKKEERML